MPTFLPDFSLPSDPAKTVRLMEATVADAIDFTAIDPLCEEEATTLFLERLQAKDKYSDPRLWTAEDRRYALFFYHLQTTQYADIPLTFRCEACSEAAQRDVLHTVPVKLADIAAEYMPITGKSMRDVVHEGHAIIVHPLLGADAEFIEKTRMGIITLEKETKTTARKERAQLSMLRILCCIDIPAMDGKTEQDRRKAVEAYILGMAATEFKQFMAKVLAALAEMQHGLRSIFQDGRTLLESPAVYCPEGKDKEGPGIRLRFPFRAFDYIPHL